MKKIIITLNFCFIICAAFSQSYKQIKFTSSSSIYPAGTTSSNMIKGVIDIDVKDSVVNVTPSYGGAESFKITSIDDDQTVIYEDKIEVKTLLFRCTNKTDGRICFISLLRQTQPKKKPAMNVALTYSAKSKTTYICDYLKDLQ